MTVQSHRGIVLFIQETMSLYLEAPFLRPVEVRLFRNKSEVCVFLLHMLSVFFFYLPVFSCRGCESFVRSKQVEIKSKIS